MENSKEMELNLLQLNFYKTEYEKQDVANMDSFKKWKEYQQKRGKKLVRCPHCWSYEISNNQFIYKCNICRKYYCQKCLKCLEYNSKHNHKPFYYYCCNEDECSIYCGDCCCELCSFVCKYTDVFYKDLDCFQIFLYSLLFLFGTPIFLTVRYLNFFRHNKITNNLKIHWFFTTINFITNIIYSCLFTFFYIGLILIIYLPGLIFYKYFICIVGDFSSCLKFEIDDWLFFNITVRRDSI